PRLRPYHPFEPEAFKVRLGILGQLDDDAGAAARSAVSRRRRDRKRALAVGRPVPGFLAAGATGEGVDTIRNHERRIKADTELADQGCAFGALRSFDAIHER